MPHLRGVGAEEQWHRGNPVAVDESEVQSDVVTADVPRPRRATAQIAQHTHREVLRVTNERGDAAIRLLFDGWQISGENAFIAGDWAPVTLTTTDNFDFTGGEMGQGQCAAGSDPCLASAPDRSRWVSLTPSRSCSPMATVYHG